MRTTAASGRRCAVISAAAVRWSSGSIVRRAVPAWAGAIAPESSVVMRRRSSPATGGACASSASSSWDSGSTACDSDGVESSTPVAPGCGARCQAWLATSAAQASAEAPAAAAMTVVRRIA